MRDVLFAILPEVVLLDVAGAAEAFRMAEQLVPGSYNLQFVGSSSTVRSRIGFAGKRKTTDWMYPHKYDTTTQEEVVVSHLCAYGAAGLDGGSCGPSATTLYAGPT